MSPMTGFAVIELTTGIAGPMVGMLLSDFGADVIKVEPPGGDPLRGTAAFAGLNRGKSSLVLDADQPADARVLWERLLVADVCLIKDAGDLSAFGIDADELRQAAPRLVLAEMPPYGSEGETPWQGGHESNALLAAYSGLAWRQASFDGTPVEWVRPQFLYAQAIWATACTVAALTERERSGWGQHVEVTGLHGVMVMSSGQFATFTDAPDPITAVGVAGRHPTYSRFRASDGKWFVVGGLGPKFEPLLLNALGLIDILDDPRVGHLSKLLEPSNYGWVSERIRGVFATKPRAEWLDMLERLGIAGGAIESSDKWLDHPQIEANGLHVRVQDPTLGEVSMPGIPLVLHGSPGDIRGAAPALGEDRTSPRTPASGPGGIPMPAAVRPGPLSGFTVLDMGTFVAGPYTGSLLAELGADVIKVEPSRGDPFRQSGFTYNRGMRSLALDLKGHGGVEALHAVVRNADAVVSSNRPGTAAALGVDYASLSRVNPKIVLMTLSGYGEKGPLAGQPGVDMVLQGMSGMMTGQGGDSEPVCNTLASIDTASGAIGALGVALALLHRERTGEGQQGSFSLAATATALQFCELVRFEGKPPAVPGGQDFKGARPDDRFYAAADGWVRLQAIGAQSDLDAMAGTSPDASSDDIQEAIAARMKTMSAQAAVAWAQSHGFAAVVTRKISQAQRDEQLLESEFVHVRPAAAGRTMFAPGRFARFSRTSRRGPMSVAGVGESTVAILRDAGVAREQIEALLSSGVATQGDPAPQTLGYIYR
ncbi:CoA transferase [Microbacterium sp. zg-YB36]|uniref:CaiB/BaiF CoA transferase family protein n=1 Tax=Microbacterium sp. zg-YB36 TaxID=2969407 RepID=UPI00214AC94E|nr:CoA transferase [Microbacterium sp. zg-YB36]MDL5353151.1 CoA transferase [Microbacterium sp. zg-YB36]